MGKESPEKAGGPRNGEPFWRRRPLAELSRTEWESLCDGCGRCCLVKLEDEDTGEIYFTDVGCRLLDVKAARCSDYGHRSRRVKDCLRLDPHNAAALKWLPPTCAYRLVAHGQDLPDWHPLVSGRAESVAEAGVSILGRVDRLETGLSVEDLMERVVSWPGRVPKAAKKRPAKKRPPAKARP